MSELQQLVQVSFKGSPAKAANVLWQAAVDIPEIGLLFVTPLILTAEELSEIDPNLQKLVVKFFGEMITELVARKAGHEVAKKDTAKVQHYAEGWITAEEQPHGRSLIAVTADKLLWKHLTEYWQRIFDELGRKGWVELTGTATKVPSKNLPYVKAKIIEAVQRLESQGLPTTNAKLIEAIGPKPSTRGEIEYYSTRHISAERNKLRREGYRV